MFENLKSWKTTLCGVATLIFAVIFFSVNRPLEGGMCVVAGIGLLSAKDSTVTGVGTSTKTLDEIENKGK